ncbi:MAG: hypothetical protein M1821_009574 [Bathelium mastoideum]|nr:MAG: hypothetical protein M1821_009574 [Bathelium mastoideum]
MAGLLNISQPVFSRLAGVEFGVLSTEEIREISVKRISNPQTFSTMLHPNQGGLYDTALGPYGDMPCDTCRQLYGCPGHCGHIELPTPVYHPSFLDQCMRLLRGQCVYCHKFKHSRADMNLFCGKLRLLRYGLVKESSELENVTAAAKHNRDSDASDDEQADSLIIARNQFVKTKIKEARRAGLSPLKNMGKDESVSEARAAVIKDFLAAMTRGTKCANCEGYVPSYRKDGARQIFRKPLPVKYRRQMHEKGYQSKNLFVELARQQQARAKAVKKKAAHVDEAVADLEDQSPEEEEGEDLVTDAGITGGDAILDEAAEEREVRELDKEQYLTPVEVRASLVKLFELEDEVLRLVYGPQSLSSNRGQFIGADLFFLRALLITPNRYRPEARTGDDQVNEASDNGIYKTILTQCQNYASISRALQGLEDQPTRPRTINDLKAACVSIQDAVNHIIDSDRARGPPSARNTIADGIKQKLEKKEGLFRMNMMGKRVNFAARSVISPDPNIQTNEIGVPLVFARKLTYPEPVTDHNFAKLKEAVMNGPTKWPGAVAVEDEKGLVMNLRYKNVEARQAIANQLMSIGPRSNGARPKKVHRHIRNGDMVIMNRQPTLHKPSMMCHRVRVLPKEKTIRMHYANCNTYNADFDGDEMNMHFPQNEIAQAEALMIADTDHQYLSATAGKPLRGLIQDHISISVRLTRKDTFFDKEKYYQLLNSALRPEDCESTPGRIVTIPPAIMKPKPMWSGKQIMSTILKNIIRSDLPGINLESKSQLSGEQWGGSSPEESKVLFSEGQLLMGILDKKQIGPAGGGFVNTIYEAYGHTTASRLLSVMGRLLTRMLNTHANSCGMEDLVYTPVGEAKRKELLKQADEVGLSVAAKYVSLDNRNTKDDDPELLKRLEDVLRDDAKQMGLDQITNSSTRNLSSEITKNCLPWGLIKPFPKNHMQSMTGSGAKGTPVNANLISCNLGQQVLEGRRVPVMISGKTLPCFKPFETSIRAGGYIVDRFLTGLRPQESFFHAMAGREGLIDTAVKTASSGYLQRCVIKGMEGLKVEYDTSVRDSDGSIVQFLYGEDGLDIVKVPYLYDFKFTASNFVSVFEQVEFRDNIQHFKNDEAADYNKAAIKKVRKTGKVDAMDPALARYNPGRWAGSTSESFYNAVREYCESNKDKLIRDKKKGIQGTVSKSTLQGVLDLKYLRSTIEPGEPVGIVAGQSIGEPSTQMTLNTFHLAGHSAKNVTLGIPRLRELLMTASASIKTPTSTMHMAPGRSSADADEVAKSISRVALSDVIDNVTVKEHIGSGIAYSDAKIYNIRLDFFPSGEYYSEYNVLPSDVVEALERTFLPALSKLLKKEIRKKSSEKSLNYTSDALPTIGKSAGVTEQASAAPAAEREGGRDDVGGGDGGGDDDADDADNEDDGDATNTKDKRNQNQDVAYDAPDDDEEADRRAASPDVESEDETYGGSPRATPAPMDDDEEENEGEGEYTGADGTRHRWSAAEQATLDTLAAERQSRVQQQHSSVTGFRFDDRLGAWAEVRLEYSASTPKLLMLNVVEQACRAAVVRHIPGLATCFAGTESIKVDGQDVDVPVVHTQGVNLLAMRDIAGIDKVNPDKLFTNDIAAMLRLYGVEAARATIMREVGGVFTGHAISVDARHLQLVADFMTRGGGYVAFNRHGMKGSVSPFMKMSFETTVGFLKDAVLEEDWDELKGPSARIVAGTLSKVGTGSFDVFMDVAARENDDRGEHAEAMEE